MCCINIFSASSLSQTKRENLCQTMINFYNIFAFFSRLFASSGERIWKIFLKAHSLTKTNELLKFLLFPRNDTIVPAPRRMCTCQVKIQDSYIFRFPFELSFDVLFGDRNDSNWIVYLLRSIPVDGALCDMRP